ncbi:cytochrome c oxidase subunit 8A, mitochondrial-like [Centroberyx gerrardi]|uniref:cytochrome c oxidase subunit 8A, mitochondrial-like n=1 Tax=Centroberyx gerrardi TaxID=166262 RepID=UPI003AAC90DF
MFSVLRRPALTRSTVQMKAAQQNHRSSIYSKPPKDKIGPVQSLFTMSVFAVTLLAPVGWIMHHIPVYRQRPPPQP